jgi:hypothetical protein
VNLQFPTTAGANFEDSTIKGSAATGTPASCTEKFVPFPEQ